MHVASALLAQAESTPYKFLYVVAILFGTIVVPFLVGGLLAKRWRMAGYEWKIGLVLASIALSSVIVGRTWNPEEGRFEFKLGVDLKGGVILIYEIDENAPLVTEAGQPGAQQEADVNMPALVEALSRRINPSGTKEIVIRPYGENQVEIIIPEVDQREVQQIKKELSTSGVLQFRIVANTRDHADGIALAREMARDPLKKRGRLVRDASGELIAMWARVAREQREVNGVRPFKLPVASDVLRDASTGEILSVPVELRGSDPTEFAQYIASEGIRDVDILMAMDDGYDVTGAHLGVVGSTTDEVLRPAIRFTLKGEGIARFGNLTRDYQPSGQFNRQLGILLDNELLSAPNIQEPIDQGEGRITGQFTREEVDFLVKILQAGSLPVVLNKIPISENRIDPLLGAETIRQGKWAIGISLGVVLVFILFYYRFAGIVACTALLANLLFILALMVLIKAAFTLPGLAGLVLTVGMSVDANVLIFERIREEMNRGAALRMAIRNGFARATRTIVDANLTTLITALVLYGIGTDQIRGFAVTLILGILMSMYTAIFCSRVLFDIADRSRSMSRLNMTQLLGATQIDFIGKRMIAGVFSLIVIGVGLVGIVARGADIFDIDFRGGTSVHVMFDKPIETQEVRDRLEEHFREDNIRFTVTAMNHTAGNARNQNIFKVDSSMAEVEDLQSAVREIFAGGNYALATYALDYSQLRTVQLELPTSGQQPPTDDPAAAAEVPEAPPAEVEEPPAGEDQPAGQAIPADEAPAVPTDAPEKAPAEKAGTPPADDDTATPSEAKQSRAAALFFETQLALADDAARRLAQATAPSDTAPADDTADASEPNEPPADVDDAADDDAPADVAAAPAAEAETGSASQATETTQADQAAAEQLEVDLALAHGINAETLRAEIEDAAVELDIPISYFELVNPRWDGESSNAFEEWTLRISATEAQTRQLLDHLQAKFADTPVWPSSSKIGSQVAGRMQNKAIAALGTSLLGIVVYIWIRFQRVIFGLAAVVALVHDVLVTLGAIALSAWLANTMGFLLIEEFKISLPIVAALLTIIGYSLNDTIVVFDRIREVRGKSPDLTEDMINSSINQTLSRTLLTSLTTLIVVVILYAIGGEGIHGFAFALVIGVLVGTYSSIFVASPALLWMTGAPSPAKGRSVAA